MAILRTVILKRIKSNSHSGIAGVLAIASEGLPGLQPIRNPRTFLSLLSLLLGSSHIRRERTIRRRGDFRNAGGGI